MKKRGNTLPLIAIAVATVIIVGFIAVKVFTNSNQSPSSSTSDIDKNTNLLENAANNQSVEQIIEISGEVVSASNPSGFAVADSEGKTVNLTVNNSTQFIGGSSLSDYSGRSVSIKATYEVQTNSFKIISIE